MSRSQVILITGATAGIGRTTALHLARAGHFVFATGRKAGPIAELNAQAAQEKLPLVAFELDVTRAESIAAAKAEVERRTERRGLDVLINNAGYGLAGPVELVSDEDVRAQFDTNVHGLLAVTRAFLPAMRRRRSGRIINVSSIGGQVTLPFFGAYNATKYAVESLSDALRMELAPFGVHVSLIEPGFIRTEFTARTIETLQPVIGAPGEYEGALRAALSRAGQAETRFAAGPLTVAKAIRRAVESSRPRARYVAPGAMRFVLALVALLPARWIDAVLRWTFGVEAPRQLPAGGTAAGVTP